jgi:predicted transposase YdaD
MAVLRESPWYQEILREGERLGEQRGRQEGRQEEGQSLILRQLTRRVGDLSAEATAQVQALSLGQLESLGEALLDFTTIADLMDWLHGQLDRG